MPFPGLTSALLRGDKFLAIQRICHLFLDDLSPGTVRIEALRFMNSLRVAAPAAASSPGRSHHHANAKRNGQSIFGGETRIGSCVILPKRAGSGRLDQYRKPTLIVNNCVLILLVGA